MQQHLTEDRRASVRCNTAHDKLDWEADPSMHGVFFHISIDLIILVACLASLCLLSPSL